MNSKARNIFVLALGIALFPPLWAVAAPYLSVKCGAVALICAGVYVAGRGTVKDGWKTMIGFWCGDLWALLALKTMSSLPWNENLSLYVTLAVLGFFAVVIASILERFIYLPAWLSGWAIGLTLMTPEIIKAEKTLPLQIAAAMAVGVWYVGVGVNMFVKILTQKKKVEE
ncbi:DUF1097 domain-containing protein [Blautia liquoris]|uniref:DUF1097 domain-containing protein n=1 Tax=Blautia liquoris TaxID=2779518 RepID=A0A7M2RDI9_9FIRM|nr:DUF1097 domain-containing protein [Blautia liquoris]QOV18356.1 DUF1097 domain-containing protein [Blautia liquoris]